MSNLDTRETILVCDGECCGGNTFNLIRTFDYDTKKITHRTVCAVCGKEVIDPNEIRPEYHISLRYELTVKARNREEAIKFAQEEISKFPGRYSQIACDEV